MPAKRRRQRASDPFEENLRKLQPRLRMIANGSERVNALRAVRSSAVAIPGTPPALTGDRVTGDPWVPIARAQLRASEKRGRLDKRASNVLANVFIELVSGNDGADLPLKGPRHRKGRVLTSAVRLTELARLAQDPAVSHIELGQPITIPRPAITASSAIAPSPKRWTFDDGPDHGDGADVLIGIIDVQGFDFSHPEFLDAKGKTRFLRIWDQGGTERPSPKANRHSAFTYGSEFLQKDLDAAITAAKKLKVPAWEIERQSQLDPGSHGTHVASIAAGKHGICRKAGIVGVLISLPPEDLDARKSFYDSTRIAHAVEYLLGVADELKKPISINISLGTNGHAHDASSAVARWIDSALATPGRCVTVAAGNAGQESAQFEGDRGYVMGRIHTSGTIPARGLTTDIEWIVVGNGIQDISENELEIWYGPQDRFSVSLLPPGPNEPERWLGPVYPGQFIENKVLDAEDTLDGNVVSIYNELYHPANGANYIALYLSPFYADSGSVGIAAGTWTVRLHGEEVRDGRFHGWIERDDPRPMGRARRAERWSFPSYFSERSNVDHSSVSSLACAQWVIAVANLDEARERINVTSSQGPTRDNRTKPEVAAPGTDIVAAKGFSGGDDPWIAMTGTSMASPYVAGVAGLMLAVNPRLTAAQVGGIIQRTSRPLPGGSYTWQDDAGFGAIDPTECLKQAEAAAKHEDLNASPKRRRRRRARRTR